MKALYTTFVVAFAVFTNAQNLPNIPQCALNCFVNTFSTDGCSSLTDFACHCSKPGIQDKITPCVQQACSAADQATVIKTVEDTCNNVGHPISVTASAGGANPTGGSPSGVSVSGVSGTVASSVSGQPVSTVAGGGTVVGSMPTVAPTRVSSNAGSATANGGGGGGSAATATASMSTFTGAAAVATAASGAFVALAMGAAALL